MITMSTRRTITEDKWIYMETQNVEWGYMIIMLMINAMTRLSAAVLRYLMYYREKFWNNREAFLSEQIGCMRLGHKSTIVEWNSILNHQEKNHQNFPHYSPNGFIGNIFTPFKRFNMVRMPYNIVNSSLLTSWSLESPYLRHFHRE